jgi:hypothetical protein
MATATAPPVVTPRSQAKVLFFGAFFALTVFAIYDKDARVFDPTSAIARHFTPVKWYVIVHGFFGAIAMAVAAFQFFQSSPRTLSAPAPRPWIYLCN